MEKLKKGKYYVGDPCYLFDKSWSKVLTETKYFQSEEIIKIFNKDCIVGNTADGDGSYFDNHGRKYYVDTGFIGVIPVSLIEVDNRTSLKEIDMSAGMHIITFEEDFNVSVFYGRFLFGDILIDTQDYEYDYEEEY